MTREMKMRAAASIRRRAQRRRKGHCGGGNSLRCTRNVQSGYGFNINDCDRFVMSDERVCCLLQVQKQDAVISRGPACFKKAASVVGTENKHG